MFSHLLSNNAETRAQTYDKLLKTHQNQFNYEKVLLALRAHSLICEMMKRRPPS